MLKNHLKDRIIEELGYDPTKDQINLIDLLAEFTLDLNMESIMLVKGYAGTGKTTVMSALVKVLKKNKMRYILLAPTGRAAKVLSNYSHSPAYTIHKKIYRQKSGNDSFSSFTLNKNLHSNTLFFVDEASMISNQSPDSNVFGTGRLLDDLIEYVYNGKNCRLILIGDTAQLPPVGLNISPALDKKVLSDYLFEVQAVTLRQVVRQSANSGILVNATAIRERIANDSKGIPSIQIEGFQDIVPLSGNLLIETLTNHYDKDGLNNVLVVCRSNKRANQYNAGIRNQILWREEEISIGDFLMVVKNNYFWLPENENTDFIANGDIVEIIRIKNYEEMYGLRFANVTIRLMDYKELEIDVKIMLDTLTVEAPALTMEKSKAFFYSVAEDYAEIRSKKKRWEKIRENEYFNALQVKFSYAVTCHKAQGGQWNTVFIDQGFINEERADKEYLRWLYTAITRSTQKVYLINFKQDFFPGISLDEYY